MSMRSRKRSLESLQVLVRLRKIKETRTLTDLAAGRHALARKTAAKEVIHAQREECWREMERPRSGRGSGETARCELERRRHLDALHRLEGEADRQVNRVRRKWAIQRNDFVSARARRRACQAARDRRASECEVDSMREETGT